LRLSACRFAVKIGVCKYLWVAKDYRPVDRDQAFLLPPSMIDWLPDEHLVWFVIEAVRQLDTTALHVRARLGGVGRRGYDPDMLLTLWMYAMAHGQRSSRQIERLCGTDVAFRIICASDVPDHTVLATFRKVHEAVLADLLTASLHLCAQLGMLRFGVVALDGVRIAANAAKDANRTEDGLRRLAEAHLAAAAATDDAEDALFGEANRGDEIPERVRDRTHRGQRIRQALEQIRARKATEQAAADAERAAGEAYTEAAADPDRPARSGRPPKGADPVAAAHARWHRERARAQAKHDAWQAKADQAAQSGHRLPGSVPAPADEQRLVRQAYAAYQHALAAAQLSTDLVPAPPRPTRATSNRDQHNRDQHNRDQHNRDQHNRDQHNRDQQRPPTTNLTDPDSRLLSTRHGYIQGYNCMDAASEDQFIIYAEVTQDTNDIAQFEPIMNGIITTAADLTTRVEHSTRDRFTIGTLLADAGFNSDHNLTIEGPDRLIAQSTSRDLHTEATTTPATGDPPPDATNHQRMSHRLRTTESHQLYKRRSPLIEAPHGWIKDRRGLRRFSRRGLPAARAEFRFAATVTNLLHLQALGITHRRLAELTN
jgi:transposase